MSTSGFYNYHPKVAHPTTIFPQMESGGFQTPFFFGGSQVPVNLGLATGSGFRTSHKFTVQAEWHGYSIRISHCPEPNNALFWDYEDQPAKD